MADRRRSSARRARGVLEDREVGRRRARRVAVSLVGEEGTASGVVAILQRWFADGLVVDVLTR